MSKQLAPELSIEQRLTKIEALLEEILTKLIEG